MSLAAWQDFIEPVLQFSSLQSCVGKGPIALAWQDFRDFEISKNGERVGTIIARLAVSLETCGLVHMVKTSNVEYF